MFLTGARQVGKSTLLRQATPFKDWRYQTMDDFDALQLATENPQDLWAGTDAVILDEVQKAVNILPAVKKAVDEKGRHIRFILSGSANLLLMQQVSESLAGRAVYFVLEPMAQGELNHASPPTLLQNALRGQWPEEQRFTKPPDVLPLLQRGFLPALLRFQNEIESLQWWDGYVATYLERDLRQISRVDSLLDFRRMMELLALRTGQLVNQSELGRDARLSQSTINRYINLLETTYLFQRLPAYTASKTTRLLKSPKAFWSDPALPIFLSGYYDQESLRASRELGNYFETFIFMHLRVLAGLLTPRARLYFWRTRKGDEIDFVVEHGRNVVAIGVKMTENPQHKHAAGLRHFLENHSQVTGGLLLHSGEEVKRLAENIVAIPWTMLTG